MGEGGEKNEGRGEGEPGVSVEEGGITSGKTGIMIFCSFSY